MAPQNSDATTQPTLARRLGLFDATMIVMGGIIGSGIFMNPSVVALQVHTPFLILGAWAIGGLFALAAAFIWAELAARRPVNMLTCARRFIRRWHSFTVGYCCSWFKPEAWPRWR
jgi:amino acid transporter